jgi:hypothetical protein
MKANAASASKRVLTSKALGLVECSRATQVALWKYAARTGTPMASVVDEAINDWLTCVAPAREGEDLFSVHLGARRHA